MYSHHIQDMVEVIARNVTLTKKSKAQIKLTLEGYWNQYAVDVWSIKDVVSHAHENGYPMSADVAQDLLQSIEENLNAEFGITWNTIGEVITDWYDSFDFHSCPDGDLENFTGCFVARITDKKDDQRHHYFKDADLLNVKRECQRLFRKENVKDIEVAGVSKFIKENNLASAYDNGQYIFSFVGGKF